ncbi:MAG: hypothetical protein WC254_06845 [Candidatus Woesearchaeota archaeon]|jgi:hypothetical protein
MTNTKAEGLRWLSQQTDLGFLVPQFCVLDVSVYADLIRQVDISRLETATEDEVKSMLRKGSKKSRLFHEETKKVLSQFSDKNTAVRSSALVGEDDSIHSGAGIYTSEMLDKSAMTPNGFWDRLASKPVRNLREAVLNVYGSLYSQKARSYLKDVDTSSQGMEVIIQEIAPTMIPFSYGHQKSLNIYYGTAQTRLHTNGNIAPVHYAHKLGRVVGLTDDGDIEKRFFNRETQELIYPASKYLSTIEQVLQQRLLPLLEKLKERYNAEFEVEFCIDLTRAYGGWNGYGDHDSDYHPENYDLITNADIYLLQIRPLTNLRDLTISFPEKEPILIGEVHAGEGEFIGPWYGEKNTWGELQTLDSFGERPATGNYAYILKELSQVDGGAGGEGTSNVFDALYGDSRIKAAVATTLIDNGIHVQTMANEKGFILVGRNSLPLDELLGRITGKYIHVVSDGIKSAVYNATEEEYNSFLRK